MLLYASGVVGRLASAFGAYSTFRRRGRRCSASMTGGCGSRSSSASRSLAALAIYAISQFTHRREMPSPPARADPEPGD